MAKTQEELNILKEEVETLDKKLAELTDEELKIVNGGLQSVDCSTCGLFLQKESNNYRSFLNCKRYDPNVNLCPVLSDLGYEA